MSWFRRRPTPPPAPVARAVDIGEMEARHREARLRAQGRLNEALGLRPCSDDAREEAAS